MIWGRQRLGRGAGFSEEFPKGYSKGGSGAYHDNGDGKQDPVAVVARRQQLATPVSRPGSLTITGDPDGSSAPVLAPSCRASGGVAPGKGGCRGGGVLSATEHPDSSSSAPQELSSGGPACSSAKRCALGGRTPAGAACSPKHGPIGSGTASCLSKRAGGLSRSIEARCRRVVFLKLTSTSSNSLHQFTQQSQPGPVNPPPKWPPKKKSPSTTLPVSPPLQNQPHPPSPPPQSPILTPPIQTSKTQPTTQSPTTSTRSPSRSPTP